MIKTIYMGLVILDILSVFLAIYLTIAVVCFISILFHEYENKRKMSLIDIIVAIYVSLTWFIDLK